MSRESFEDEELAELLNKNFISIKVDKEERPDIDNVYMTVCQTVTGHGGWPLTVIMTPDAQPFYVATYLPKNTGYGLVGLLDLLNQVNTIWRNNPDELIETGHDIIRIMKREFEGRLDKAEVTKDLVGFAVTQLKDRFDHDYGGFGNEPKFPTPHNLILLLAYSCLEADDKSAFMVENTLINMYKGGIYDHIGYGFSRYSTDAKWLVPHFEKMLYDNALLTIAYLEAYQHRKKPLYKTIATQILEYVRREMTDREGGFYSAQDADSEGVEGRYYVFKPEEITEVLQNDDAGFFCNYFNITKEGNFKGFSIPNRLHANELNPDNERVSRLCNYIYRYRQNRYKLHKDDKILTSWNSLMISAYAKAATILQCRDYADIAERAVDFINTRLIDDNGKLYVRYRDGEAANNGNLDDYAFFCHALLCVYEATFDIRYLRQAIDIADKMLLDFWDDINEGFYLTGNESEELIFRPKEVYDGAIPSGNSVAGYVLLKIAHITANPKYREYADKQLRFLAGQARHFPAGYCFAQLVFLNALYPSKEIICVVSNKDDNTSTAKTVKRNPQENPEFDELKTYMASHYNPNMIVLVKTGQNEAELERLAEYTKDYQAIDDKTTYYICENYSCHTPVTELPII